MQNAVAIVDLIGIRLFLMRFIPGWRVCLSCRQQSIGGGEKSNATTVIERREEVCEVGKIGVGLISKPMEPNQ